ncbi:MAG TPA: hypothetical protein VK302_18380 [Terriglobales bacterium]|nr:hypothetical protein [Terriglobales bacterium]
MKPIKIGIIGDFNPDYAVHRATNESIQHSAQTLGQPVEAVWLPTDKAQQYERFQGFIGAPASPYRSFENALAGIRYAREHGVRFSALVEDSSISSSNTLATLWVSPMRLMQKRIPTLPAL